MSPRPLLLSLPGLILVACQSAALEPALSAGGEENHRLLESSIAGMMGGIEVSIGVDAFTERSDLVLERRQQQRPNPPAVDGRIQGMPNRFRLWIEDGTCVLERVDTAQTISIPDLSCRPAG